MTEKTGLIVGILNIMRSCWDLPGDCNEGELFAYAEMLLNRIEIGVSTEALYAYLAKVQVDNLEMPASDAYREVVDRSVVLVKSSRQAPSPE
jgi:hypothetical protein